MVVGCSRVRTGAIVATALALAADIVVHLATWSSVSGESSLKELSRNVEFTTVSVKDVDSTLWWTLLPVTSVVCTGLSLIILAVTVAPGAGTGHDHRQHAKGLRRQVHDRALQTALSGTRAVALVQWVGLLADTSAVSLRVMNTRRSETDLVWGYTLLKVFQGCAIAVLWCHLCQFVPGILARVDWAALKRLSLPVHIQNTTKPSIPTPNPANTSTSNQARIHINVGANPVESPHQDVSARTSGGSEVVGSELRSPSDEVVTVAPVPAATTSMDASNSTCSDSNPNNSTRQRKNVHGDGATPSSRVARTAAPARSSHWELQRANAHNRAVLAAALHHKVDLWKWPSVLLMAVLVAFVVLDFSHIVSSQGALVPESVLLELQSPAHPAISRPQHEPPTRVVLVILDGLRYDRTTEVDAFAQLLNNETFSQDAQVYEARARIPTMSVPNWLSILTGGEPELHGVLGNILIPETKLDSVFGIAQTFGLRAGMAASPPFEAIVRSTLPVLSGAAVVDYDFGLDQTPSDVPLPSNVVMDEMLTNVTLSALDAPYNNDVDLQGHAFGVSTEFNTRDTYNKAVARKIANTRRVLDAVDNNTVVIVTSDHGHVDPGGHGGVDDALLRVPLIVYQRGSGLGNRTYVTDGPSLRSVTESQREAPTQAGMPVATLLDVAPTITALLGLPPPGCSQGVILPAAWQLLPPSTRLQHYQALLLQQRRLVHSIAVSQMPIEFRASGEWTDVLNNETQCASIEDCAASIRTVRTAYDSMRDNDSALQSQRIVATSVVLTVVTMAYFFAAWANDPFASPSLLLPRRCRRDRRSWPCRGNACCGGNNPPGVARVRTSCHALSLALCGTQAREAVHTSSVASVNRLAMGMALAMVGVFFGITMAGIVGIFALAGYTELDSTLLAHESVLQLYFATTLGVSFTLATLLTAMYTAWLVAPHVTVGAAGSCLRQGARAVRQATLRCVALANPAVVVVERPELLHLVQLNMLFLSTSIVCITMWFRAPYALIAPGGFRVLWLYPDTWVLRFQVMMMQTVEIPLLAVSLWAFLSAKFVLVKRQAGAVVGCEPQVLAPARYDGPQCERSPEHEHEHARGHELEGQLQHQHQHQHAADSAGGDTSAVHVPVCTETTMTADSVEHTWARLLELARPWRLPLRRVSRGSATDQRSNHPTSIELPSTSRLTGPTPAGVAMRAQAHALPQEE